MKKSVFGKAGTFTLFIVLISMVWPKVKILAKTASPYQTVVSEETSYVDKYFEIDKDGNFKVNIWLGDELLATEDGQDINYYLPDHLGSVTQVLDEKGQIVEQNDYEPFGRINYQSADVQDYKFAGKLQDKESNLQYFEQRYFSPTLARFSSLDPLLLKATEKFLSDPQQLNSYTYGRNNPVRFIDPTGEANYEFQPYYSSNGVYNTGNPLGSYRGITVYSGGDLYGTGSHNYQCVSLGQSFAQTQYGVDLRGTGHGYAYGDQSALKTSFSANNPDNPGQYTVYNNSGTIMPQENDMISWSGGNYGHVGFISEVVFDDKSGTGYVYSIEQNADRNRAIFYQPLTRSHNEDGQAVYTVGSRFNSYQVQGWARYENQSLLNGPEQKYINIPYTPATQFPIVYRP